jgi:hypothetical protein
MSPEGITDRPIPPWELPGAFRRDCLPHRADWLSGLARAGHVAASFALRISVPVGLIAVSGPHWRKDMEVSAALAVLFAVPALLLGVTALAQARRDLGLMLRGLMDPSGRGRTTAAVKMGRETVVFSLFICGAAVAVLLLALCCG